MTASKFKKLIFIGLSICVFSAQAKTTCLDSAADVLKQARDLQERKQHLLASIQFSTAQMLTCDRSEKAEAKLGYALSMMELHETAEAFKTLSELRTDAQLSPLLKTKTDLALGWLEPQFRNQLDPDLQLRFEIWENRYSPELIKSRLSGQSANYKKKTLELVEKTDFAREKNPWVAGVASALVPGLGQVYNGNYQSAALSFVINALFLSTALEFQDKGLYAASNAAAVVFSVTYVGGILSSVQSSQAINRNKMSGYDQELKGALFTF